MSEPMPTLPTQSPFTYPNPNSSASPSFTQDDTFMPNPSASPSFTQDDTFMPNIPEPIQPMPTFTQHAHPAQTNSTEGKILEMGSKRMSTGYRMPDHNLWRIVQQGNSPKRLGKDAKGNTIVHPPVSLDEHVVVQRENKLLFAPTHSAFIGTACSGSKPTYSDQQANDHAGRKQTVRVEKVYGMMAGLHADNGGAGISNAADEFAMMGISPKAQKEKKKWEVKFEATLARFEKWKESSKNLENNLSFVNLKQHCVPAGSRNSSASVTADGSDPAASRNRPAVNSAGRPKPTERVGQPAGWSKPPTHFSLGNPSIDNDIGIVDSGCSRSMTETRKKLTDFVHNKGGIIKFGGGDGRISGKAP
ncbi:hypothetical protein Tco_0112143 [Tanacetum coccineum]